METHLIALREALIAHLPKGPNIRTVERPGWLQVINTSGSRVDQNTIYISEFPPTATEEEVNSTINLTISEYKQLGLCFRWILGPWSRPNNLEALLLKNGLFLGRRAYGMTRSTDIEGTRTNQRITLEQVSPSNIETWARTYCRAWELPENSAPAPQAYAKRCLEDSRFVNYLAYLDGNPVAIASSAFLKYSAYFSNTAVLPEYRGKGIFRELVESRCRAAAERGQRTACLYAFEDTSFPILKTMGFEVDCESPQYFHTTKDGGHVPA